MNSNKQKPNPDNARDSNESKNDFPYINIFASLVIILSTLAIYWSTLNNPFVFDSTQLNKKSLLLSLTSNFFEKLLSSNRAIGGYLLGINVDLFGNDIFWFRLVNVFFHIGNALLIFIFLKQLFSTLNDTKGKSTNTYNTLACVGALFFCLNPSAIYATTYVIQRFILSATFFSLLALNAYLRGILKNKILWVLGSVVFYFLAVHSKEQAVMLPTTFVCLTILIRKDIKSSFIKKLIIPYILFFAIGLHITLILKGLLISSYEPFSSLVLTNTKAQLNAPLAHITQNNNQLYPLSVLNQMWIYFRYIYLWIVPDINRMSIDLPRPFILEASNWKLVLGAIAFITYGVTAFALLFKKGIKGLLGFGLIFPWLFFMVELSTVRLHENFVLYRSYLWMCCFFSVLPFLVNYIPKIIRWIAIPIYCLILIGATHNRLQPFESQLSLWKDATTKISSPENHFIPSAYRSHINYGLALFQQNKYHKAFLAFKKSIQLNPNYNRAWYHAALALDQIGRYDEALKHYNQALKLKDDDKKAHLYLGWHYLKTNQVPAAIASFNKAIKISPNFITAHASLGTTLAKTGNYTDAIHHLKQVLKLNSNHPFIHYNLGIVFAANKDDKKAIVAFKESIKRQKNSFTAHYHLGKSYYNLGKYKLALNSLNQALKIKPGDTQALQALKLAMSQSNAKE